MFPWRTPYAGQLKSVRQRSPVHTVITHPLDLHTSRTQANSPSDLSSSYNARSTYCQLEPPKRRGELSAHVTLASLILCRGLARSSRNLALYSSIRRSLSSFIDCLCGRAGIMVRKVVEIAVCRGIYLPHVQSATSVGYVQFNTDRAEHNRRDVELARSGMRARMAIRHEMELLLSFQSLTVTSIEGFVGDPRL